MIKSNRPVVLDPCVLAETAVSDLILRLSEKPRLLRPMWTEHIWTEVRLTWIEKFGWPEAVADSWIVAATGFFPEAMVTDYEMYIEQCENHPKDRHVLAAAIQAKANKIATFNIKDFKPEAVAPWGISAVHPAELLSHVFDQHPSVVTGAIQDMAAQAQRSLPEMLSRLAWYVEPFSQHVGSALSIEVPAIAPRDWHR